MKDYVKSFALRSSDTILIELSIPYEIIDWDKDIVRTFTRVKSFSMPNDIMRRVSRMGRYRMKSMHKDGVMKLSLPDIHHKIVVDGIQLQEEVVAKIYVPEGFPLKVVCNSKTKEEQIEDLWLQQEVLTRKLNFPIRKAINADHYSDVDF